MNQKKTKKNSDSPTLGDTDNASFDNIVDALLRVPPKKLKKSVKKKRPAKPKKKK